MKIHSFDLIKSSSCGIWFEGPDLQIFDRFDRGVAYKAEFLIEENYLITLLLYRVILNINHLLLYHFDDIDQRTKVHHFIDFMVIHQFLISLMITEYIPITKNIKSLLFNKKSSFETTTSIITVFIELLCVDELLDVEEGVLRRIGGESYAFYVWMNFVRI